MERKKLCLNTSIPIQLKKKYQFQTWPATLKNCKVLQSYFEKVIKLPTAYSYIVWNFRKNSCTFLFIL